MDQTILIDQTRLLLLLGVNALFYGVIAAFIILNDKTYRQLPNRLLQRHEDIFTAIFNLDRVQHLILDEVNNLRSAQGLSSPSTTSTGVKFNQKFKPRQITDEVAYEIERKAQKELLARENMV